MRFSDRPTRIWWRNWAPLTSVPSSFHSLTYASIRVGSASFSRSSYTHAARPGQAGPGSRGRSRSPRSAIDPPSGRDRTLVETRPRAARGARRGGALRMRTATARRRPHRVPRRPGRNASRRVAEAAGPALRGDGQPCVGRRFRKLRAQSAVTRSMSARRPGCPSQVIL